MSKLIGITIGGITHSCQVDEAITLVTSDNVEDIKSEWDLAPGQSMQWNVNLSGQTIELSDELKKMKHKPELTAEITLSDGQVIERDIKKYGSRMVSKIDRNKAYARPIVYYIDEFYCKF